MAEVLGQVTEWVSDDVPGWVKVELIDADGRTLTVVDKVPVLFDASHTVDPTTPLPKDAWLACNVVPLREGRLQVTLDHGVETEDGASSFEVTPDRVR